MDSSPFSRSDEMRDIGSILKYHEADVLIVARSILSSGSVSYPADLLGMMYM